MAEPKKKRTWIVVVVGILISFFVLGAVMIGSAVFYVRRHISAQFVDTKAAADEFDRTRARFAGQEPLIELRGEHDAVVHRRRATTTTELRTLRIIAFDEHQGKLVRVNIPFWFLRMMPGKRFNMKGEQGIDLDTDRMHLTVDDLERAGPGLVIDGTGRHGDGRVLVWTE